MSFEKGIENPLENLGLVELWHEEEAMAAEHDGKPAEKMVAANRMITELVTESKGGN